VLNECGLPATMQLLSGVFINPMDLQRRLHVPSFAGFGCE